MIAGHQQREERGRLRREATGEGYRTAAALEACHALFENGECGIHDPRVGVAVLLKIEVRRRRCWIFEHVARGLKNRHRASASIRLRTLAGVNLAGFEPETTRLFQGRRLPMT